MPNNSKTFKRNSYINRFDGSLHVLAPRRAQAPIQLKNYFFPIENTITQFHMDAIVIDWKILHQIIVHFLTIVQFDFVLFIQKLF